MSTIARLLEKTSPKSGSLIITVFGDAIAPRGGELWLGNLIDLLQPFGVSERLVRTGVYRLAREGWLTSRSQGRRSFYAITEAGIRIFAAADTRIYAAELPAWDGQWLIAHLGPSLTVKSRNALRRALQFDGFGELSPSVMLRPWTQTTGLNSTMIKTGAAGKVVFFTGTLAALASGADARSVVASAWDLDDLNLAYHDFIETFSHFDGHLPACERDQFVLQTLLIHQYRRILLQDPQLPPDLLPAHWLGSQARQLASSLYRSLSRTTSAFIDAAIETWDGSPASHTEALERRFA